jgi:hypothetical protein
MRQFFSRFIFVALIAVPAFSQHYDNPYGDRDRARQDRALFDRARMDLDRASNYPYASRADRKRFDEARRDLIDFASRFDQGLYERHQLDHAIERMDRVARENSLDPRDRGTLEDDLRRMRDYREFRNHLR